MRVTEVSPVDATRIVDVLRQEHDRVCDTLTAEASWERLSLFFLNKLRDAPWSLNNYRMEKVGT